jgi:PAS domain S-box-containing protein
MESRAQGFVDEDGKDKVFLIARDVTFRKQAEQKIKESEEKYRHLFENSPNAIVLVTLKGVVMDCNPATTSLFGYEKEDLVDKHFIDIAAYPSELRPQFINSFKNIFQRNYNEPVEFQAYKKDGSLVWVASYLALNNLGSETFVQAIFQDITQQKRSEQIIQKEIDRLKEIDQIRNNLVRRISHELKTPLISIFSTSQHLLENYSDQVDNRILRLINTIHKGGKRLKLLAENLVNSLRLESRELTLNMQNENLVEIVSECIDTFTIFAQERKLFFKKDLPENLMLEVDKIWLSQAISNLISNAIKNTPERGGVLVKLSEERTHIDISIEDTGVGLTKKEIEKLFEKFGKLERFNEDLDIDIEGSGLGLYITREIVQLHSGDIFVYSKGRNQGSIFTIRLYKENNDS